MAAAPAMKGDDAQTMATKEQLQWLKSMVPAAQQAQRKSGIPASVTLAQCILESGWGTSGLAKSAHNYFGIKATHLDVPESYIELPTSEFYQGRSVVEHARFEKYFDAADSFEEHARLLSTAARYRAAMGACAQPNRMAYCLQAAGYSTNPKYAQLLIDLMHGYDLYAYDALPPDDPAKAQEVAAA